MQKVKSHMLKIKYGFTLVEMLVVLVIIVTVLSLSAIGIGDSIENARNAGRRNDLRQYELGLKNFSSRNNGLYPSYLTAVEAADELCTSLGLTNCPNDSKCTNFTCSGWSSYFYRTPDGSGGGNANSKNYIMWSRLEEESQTFWVMCSNGASGERGTAPATGNCPLGTPGCGCTCASGVVTENNCGICGLGCPSAICTSPNTCNCVAGC